LGSLVVNNKRQILWPTQVESGQQDDPTSQETKHYQFCAKTKAADPQDSKLVEN
jgi:hypothetical protein